MSSLVEIEAARRDLALWHDANNQGLSPLPFGMVNWTYDGDDHAPASTPLPAVVIGINPGDGNGAAKPGMSPSEARWRSNCSMLSGRSPSEIVFTELVSIPTKRVVDLEGGLTVADAVKASARLNTAILAFHSPQVVYQMGFLGGSLAQTVSIYGLEHVSTVMRSQAKGRLLEHYRLPSGLDWLSIRHFAAFGFSGEDFAGVRDYVASLPSAANLLG